MFPTRVLAIATITSRLLRNVFQGCAGSGLRSNDLARKLGSGTAIVGWRNRFAESNCTIFLGIVDQILTRLFGVRRFRFACGLGATSTLALLIGRQFLRVTAGDAPYCTHPGRSPGKVIMRLRREW